MLAYCWMNVLGLDPVLNVSEGAADDLFPGLHTRFLLPLPFPKFALNVASSVDIDVMADMTIRWLLLICWIELFKQPLKGLDPDKVECQVMVD